MDNSYGFWMERLLRLAAQAGQRGEVPVAAVVLDP
jgi:tRNA(Arg) A34 adenosine deaminase TadA